MQEGAGQLHAAGLAHHRAGRLAEAERFYRRALAVDSRHADSLHLLGVIAHEAGHHEDAVALIGQAIAGKGQAAPFHSNLALALYDLQRFEEAASSCRRAIQLRPDFVPAHYMLGLSLKDLGRLDEAIAAYREAQRLDPDFAEAHFGEGFALLMQGDFAAGWRKYEWRRKVFPLRRTYPGKQWQGEDIAGKRLLIHAEQGLGDTIQFYRYVSLAKAGEIVVEVQPSLVSLFGRVVPQGESLPGYDVHCPMMSLPGALGADMPVQIPYLQAPSDRVEYWRDRLAGIAGPRIGIAWRGNPQQSENARRSLPAESLAGIGTVCLQKDRTAAELAALPGIFDPTPDLHDFAETAAVIANLDLVISVDTAVCHLAGALGARCWTLLSFAPDWRWFLGREDSPWYPTMRLLRQERPGDWRGVMERVRKCGS